VDAAIASGDLRCPGCSGKLRPWGYARRRYVRDRWRLERIRPRRARCRGCRRTHVIVPDRTLLRRLDRVEVIGAALIASHQGLGYRRISARLSLPMTTVRDWIRRFASRMAAPPHTDPAGGAWPFNLADLITGQLDFHGSPGADWRWASRVSHGQFLR
jgi:transposase-like protein